MPSVPLLSRLARSGPLQTLPSSCLMLRWPLPFLSKQYSVMIGWPVRILTRAASPRQQPVKKLISSFCLASLGMTRGSFFSASDGGVLPFRKGSTCGWTSAGDLLSPKKGSTSGGVPAGVVAPDPLVQGDGAGSFLGRGSGDGTLPPRKGSVRGCVSAGSGSSVFLGSDGGAVSRSGRG